MEENVTKYRFDRVEELISKQDKFNTLDFAAILRNTKGLHDTDIGLGNEGAVNQLIAHHSIIFKPEEKLFWISTSPFQLGVYLAYQLDSVFSMHKDACLSTDIKNMQIPADSLFLKSIFPSFLSYKAMLNEMQKGDNIELVEFQESNPNYFYTYEALGDYYSRKNDLKKADYYYQKAFNYFIPNLHERLRLQNKLTN